MYADKDDRWIPGGKHPEVGEVSIYVVGDEQVDFK